MVKAWQCNGLALCRVKVQTLAIHGQQKSWCELAVFINLSQRIDDLAHTAPARLQQLVQAG